jgi:hypothetical protein
MRRLGPGICSKWIYSESLFCPKLDLLRKTYSKRIYSELFCAQTGFAKDRFDQKVFNHNHPCLKLDLLRKNVLRMDLLRKDLPINNLLKKDFLKKDLLRKD